MCSGRKSTRACLRSQSVYANGNIYEGEVRELRAGRGEGRQGARATLRVWGTLASNHHPSLPRACVQWVDGRINGFGTLTYADGDRYIGQWTDGKSECVHSL
jgi:hypothetical protein